MPALFYHSTYSLFPMSWSGHQYSVFTTWDMPLLAQQFLSEVNTLYNLAPKIYTVLIKVCQFLGDSSWPDLCRASPCRPQCGLPSRRPHTSPLSKNFNTPLVVTANHHGLYIILKRHELWSTNGFKLEVSFHPPSIKSAFHFIARLRRRRSTNGTRATTLCKTVDGRSR